MGQDTVLIGGLGFLFAAGVGWFLLEKVQASTWSLRAKRLATYALVGGIIAIAIYVIDWHSSNYKASFDTSSLQVMSKQLLS